MARRGFVPTSVLLSLALAGAVVSAEAPVAVSPGHASKLALVEARCPTFSWGEVEGAKSYELVVYRVGDGADSEPVLGETFAGSVSGWTPSLDRCLERGGQYAWSVRAVGADKAPEWSAPSLFEVASGPSEADFELAVSVVRQYFEEARSGARYESGEDRRASDGRSSTVVKPATKGAELALSAALAADAALQVNGAAVVTTATLAAGLCQALDRRYVDQGDGTIMDCHTGLIWLKIANCLGPTTWSEAQADAAALADGDCGLTDGSSAGDWRLPTAGELCVGWWEGFFSGTCPPADGARPTGLLQTQISGLPKIVNAEGDAHFRLDDAFDSLSDEWCYWSSTESVNQGEAWGIYPYFGHISSLQTSIVLGFAWPVRDGE